MLQYPELPKRPVMSKTMQFPRAVGAEAFVTFLFVCIGTSIVATAVVLLSFRGFISRFEASEGIARGEPGSQHSAMMFGEYFPNPDIHGADEAAQALVSAPVAALVEGSAPRFSFSSSSRS